MIDFLIDNLISAIIIGLVLAVCIIGTYIIRHKVRHQVAGQIKHSYFSNLLLIIIWVIGITIIISQFSGLSTITNALLSGSGLAAIVIGLAAQESLSNMLAGLMLSVFCPFEIGDRIQIVGDNTAGFVESMNLRHTVIRTYTNVRVIVPNSVLASSKIENSTYAKGFSYPIEVTIAFEDKRKRERAIQLMEEIVQNHPKFYDRRTEEDKAAGIPASKALVVGFSDSGVNLKILMWTADFSDNVVACSECRMQILEAFENEGIEIPYTKIDVRKRKG